MQLPGPPVKNFFLGNIADFPKDRSLRFGFMMALVEKYGDSGIIRLMVGPKPVIIVTGPKYAREIMSTSRHTSKSSIYDNIRPWLGLGLLTSQGEKWKIMRRLTTPAFHFEVLQRFLEVMNEQSSVLLDRIASQSTMGNKFDVFELITACALDIICETAMGKKVGAQNITGHTPYVQAVYDMSQSILARNENPLYTNDFVYSLSSQGRVAKQNLKILHDFTNLVIRERKASIQAGVTASQGEEDHAPRRPAFLDMLLKAQADGEGISDENIREEVDTFMFEGHDTTSASMAWTLQLLGQHSEIQERLYEEIREVMGDSKIVTYEMLSQFHYLEMVLKESLRLYPSVPGIGRVLTEDLDVEGVTVPAGTDVNIGINAIHHNPLLWTAPEKFDPERWTPENSEGRDPYQYVPFSAGPRNWSVPLSSSFDSLGETCPKQPPLFAIFFLPFAASARSSPRTRNASSLPTSSGVSRSLRSWKTQERSRSSSSALWVASGSPPSQDLNRVQWRSLT